MNSSINTFIFKIKAIGMFKTIFYLFLFLLLSASVLTSQNHWTQNQLMAQRTVINTFDALSNRDPSGIKSLCTEDVTFYEYGQIWTLDTLIHKAITTNTSPDFKRINTFDFIQTNVDKKSASLTYRLYSTVFKDGKQSLVEWLETMILARVKKQWKVKHLHSTLIKRT